jgi:sRNA-binding carbon storage regulator CsrA
MKFFRYNITFISSLSTNRFIRHSLIGHLNIVANVLLLGVLSFHRIVLHQLGLWDDFRPPTEDSLIYQTNFIPSNTKLFRNEIIRGIYSMLKKEIANDQKLQTKNFNALDEEENNIQRTIPAPSITSILPNEIVDQIKDEIKNHSPEVISHSTRNYWQKLKHVFQTVKTFYSFAIGK